MATEEDVTRVAQMLRQARRPVILAGGGVHLSQAYDELAALAEQGRIPVATSVNGKGSVAETAFYAIGVAGANGGSIEALEIVQNADVALVLGSKLNNVTTIGKLLFNNECQVVQVDIAEEALDANIRTTLAIMSDIRCFLGVLRRALAEQQGADANRLDEWNGLVADKMAHKQRRIEADVAKECELVSPACFFDALWNLTDEDTYFVADAGTPTPYLSSYFRLKKAGRHAVLPRAHGSLGYALPAAIGVQVAKPGRKVIAMHGDASFGMAVGDLETAVRCKLPVVFVNFQNYAYGWIKTIQRLYYQERYFGVDFSRSLDAAKVAQGFGLPSKTISSNQEVKGGLEWALNQDSPVLLDMMIEPPTRTVPPVLKWEKDAAKPASERVKLTY